MKLFKILLVCVVALLLSMTQVMAGDVGIDGNKNHHNQIVGGDLVTGGEGGSVDVDNNIGNGIGNFSPVAIGGDSTAYGGKATAFGGMAVSKGGDGGDASVKNSGNSNVVFGNTLIGDTFSPEANASVGDIENKSTNINTNINTNKNDNTNKNENKNYNTNFNTAHQGQDQDQEQTQGQGQNQSMMGVQANKQRTNIKIEAAEYKRGLPSGGGGVVVTEQPEHFEKASPTANQGTVEELMDVRKTFALGQLVVLSGKTGDIDCDNRAYNSLRESLGNPKKGTKKMEQTAQITLTTERPDSMDIGLFICKGDTETDGAGVIAHAMIEALRHGSTKFYVSMNDFRKVLKASGWGLSIGSSGSTIINDGGHNASGAVIAPALGYKSSTSGYSKEPFVRGFGYR